MRLNVRAFALTCGIVGGMTVFFATWRVIAFQGPIGVVTPTESIYLGYSVTPVGSLIGLAWGAFDGTVVGAIFAWLYNKLAGPNSRNKE